MSASNTEQPIAATEFMAADDFTLPAGFELIAADPELGPRILTSLARIEERLGEAITQTDKLADVASRHLLLAGGKRVRPLLTAESKRITKIMRNVPVHQIQVGRDEGQIPLKDLQSALRKLKNVLTAEEVPQVSARINALRSGEPPIPKGIDPLRVRGTSRRGLRGN